jgi:hypothetical protein
MDLTCDSGSLHNQTSVDHNGTAALGARLGGGSLTATRGSSIRRSTAPSVCAVAPSSPGIDMNIDLIRVKSDCCGGVGNGSISDCGLGCSGTFVGVHTRPGEGVDSGTDGVG